MTTNRLRFHFLGFVATTKKHHLYIDWFVFAKVLPKTIRASGFFEKLSTILILSSSYIIISKTNKILHKTLFHIFAAVK